MIEERQRPIAQAHTYPDLAIHTLGWKAFQDLCADVCEVILQRPVEIFREAQDGGQDAVFLSKNVGGPAIASVQCKFASKANERLRLSDLADEFRTVSELVEKGQADTYILLTNRRIDAPDAVTIRKRLYELGVRRPHLFGHHFLVKSIRKSSRLRALVPRVYGLGDLSSILDERSATQTEALLGHLKPLLKVYVTTKPHVEAVRSLSKNGLVLLLGDPGTGKSAIGAVLSTIAASNPDRICIKSDGVTDFIQHWNPYEQGFFWIDDAFGPNQLREDFIDSWLTHFPKVLAAIERGSQFVLTSRLHIYKGAETKLGSRNIPVFRDGQAVVHVGALTNAERLQLLYNHVKAGTQSWRFRSRIKVHLPLVAQEIGLTPEIARRVADPAYTKQLDVNPAALIEFVRNPKAHLLQTLREMSKAHQAALTLVFIHRGKLKSGISSTELQNLIIESFGVDKASLGAALSELVGSFLVQAHDVNGNTWGFKHPTVADAISALLAETEGLVEHYLRGTRPEVILGQVVCSGSAAIPDTVVIPELLNELLASVVAQIPDEPQSNSRLYDFLESRTSDAFFKLVLNRQPDLLRRKPPYLRAASVDSRINVLARAHKLGLLPEGLRSDISTTLWASLMGLDASFLDNNDILALIPPTLLLHMLNSLRKTLLSEVQDAVKGICADIDPDQEPEDHFYDLEQNLEKIRVALFGDDYSDDEPLVADIRNVIAEGVCEIKAKQEERRQDDEESEWLMENYVRRSVSHSNFAASQKAARSPGGSRSIFSDVDE